MDTMHVLRTAVIGGFALLTVLTGCARETSTTTDITGTNLPRWSRTIPLPGVGGLVERNGIAGRLDHLAYDATTERLFVAAFSKGALAVVDLKQGTLLKTLDGIPEAQGVAVAPGTNRVYVTSGEDGTLRVYDTETLHLKDTAAVIEDADNVRFDSRTGHILVGGGSKTHGALVILDALTLTKLGEVSLPAHPESFQCSPIQAQCYINLPGDKFSDNVGKVVQADLATNALLATWEVPGTARNFPMTLDSARGRIYVVGRKPAQILALDSATGAVLGSAPCVADSDDVFYDAQSRLLMVIGGGRRIGDRAGEAIPSDQPGALDVFTVSDSGQFLKLTSLPLPPHARTGLFVPERRALYVAVPVQAGEDAKLLEYKLPG
ncbi:MAG: hypothetical protein WCJ97_02640 [Phycisphaerae bacterium]